VNNHCIKLFSYHKISRTQVPVKLEMARKKSSRLYCYWHATLN